MIIEDHDMSDCLAIYSYKSRPDREASLLSLRCGIQQPVDSNHHHSFLKAPKIEISENPQISLANRFPRRRLLAVTRSSRGFDLSARIETEQ
jgi:hypothetical protein